MRAEQPGTPVFRPTILVVDDEPLVADFVTEILEPEGFNIIAADSADAALSLLEKEDANIDI
ncbi:response regulator, partial [Xanthobacter autotrophicus]